MGDLDLKGLDILIDNIDCPDKEDFNYSDATKKNIENGTNIKDSVLDFEKSLFVEDLDFSINSDITEKDIVPCNGTYLGLDISKNSTGVCIYNNGVKKLYNIDLAQEQKDILNEPHMEVLLRRSLKTDLLSIIEGMFFDIIIIEDTYNGYNAKEVRLLQSLNTAIDELILDDFCKCNKFLRIQNGVWKKWLSVLDSDNIYKGVDDKIKVQQYLKIIGISDSGKGYQDRLDSTGLLLGYFLNEKEAEELIEFNSKKKVQFKDIEFYYEQDRDFIVFEEDGLLEDNGYSERKDISITNKLLNKKEICKLLTLNPTTVFYSDKPIYLGKFGDIANIPDIFDDGGILCFKVKEGCLHKYTGG